MTSRCELIDMPYGLCMCPSYISPSCAWLLCLGLDTTARNTGPVTVRHTPPSCVCAFPSRSLLICPYLSRSLHTYIPMYIPPLSLLVVRVPPSLTCKSPLSCASALMHSSRSLRVYACRACLALIVHVVARALLRLFNLLACPRLRSCVLMWAGLPSFALIFVRVRWLDLICR
jgi:hypothetical protein